jgi:hypothetical protein
VSETKWSEDAVDEALNEFAEARESMTDAKAMRAALDKAATYEGVFPTNYVTETQKDAYMRGYSEALVAAGIELDRLGAPAEATAVRRLSIAKARGE